MTERDMTRGENIPYGHTSVLLQESIDSLDLHPEDIFVDGTLGSGGHSEEVVRRLGNDIKIIGIDMDADALARATKRFKKLYANAMFVQGNFRNLDLALDKIKVPKVTKIILDLGLSSNQFEESGRGFSFSRDEPLLMTFAKEVGEEDNTAERILNEWGEDTLEIILRGFGEERYSKKIARTIVEARSQEPIKTTHQLVNLILQATPKVYHRGKIHPATRTFQALRIATNDELGALKEGLAKGYDRLESGGRMAVITFHSLEDRIVKQFMKEKVKNGEAETLTKKPMVPTQTEISENRRARSAKLRVLVKK